MEQDPSSPRLSHSVTPGSVQDDSPSMLSEAQVQELLRGCQDSDPYERMSALRKLMQFAPERATPVIEYLAKEDPVSTIRHFCRTELTRRMKVEADKAPDQHHSINERRFQGQLSMSYLVFAVLFLGTGMFGLFSYGPGGEYSKEVYLVRFLAGMPVAHLVIAALCVWASFEVKRSTFEGYLVKWAALLMCLVSFPLGPILGTWMLFNLSGAGAKARRKRG